MLQTGRGLDLHDKPLGTQHGRELWLEDLHRNLAVVFQVLREVNRCHTTRAKVAFDAVPPIQGCVEPVCYLVHGQENAGRTLPCASTNQRGSLISVLSSALDSAETRRSATGGWRPAAYDGIVSTTPAFRLRAILLLALVAALLVLAWSDPVHVAVLQVFEVAKGIIEQHPLLGAALFVGLSGLAAMLAFFSSAVLVPAAVYAWGPVGCAALLWAGWMLGGLASYGLAWRFGEPVMRWLAPGRAIDRYQAKICEEVSFGFILLFQLALPSEIPGLVLGLARFPLQRYLAALAIAELPYAIVTTLLGASFVARDFRLLLALGALAAVTAVLLGRALRKRLQS